jgi:hypothetical protein
MKFMDDIEEEMSSQYSQSAARRKKLESEDEWSSRQTNVVAMRQPNMPKIDTITAALEQDTSSRSKQIQISEPRGNQQLRERLMELEIEREQQEKALSLLQEIRNKEKEELSRAVEEARAHGGEYADQVRNEMAARIEKQVQMIEALLQDKKALQEAVE